MTSPNKKPAKRKPKQVYTAGELNKMIDSVLHPLAKKSPAFTILDEVCHILVEDDPRESTVKFVRYSLPGILKKLLEEKE